MTAPISLIDDVDPPTDAARSRPAPPAPLPPTASLAFGAASSLEESQAQTRRLAMGHYENFSVASLLLPARLRQDFFNVYAFCRVADDLGDEVHDSRRSLELLARLRDLTHQCYEGRADTILFDALSGTIRKYDIPIQPFLDLIDAFEQDQRQRRYETFDELLGYCRRSANPVGRLVLYMCGYRDDHRQHLADQTCTALQLANFWQDVRRDLFDLDRIYIPAESMRKFGITESHLRSGVADQRYRDLVRFEVDRTEAMFDEGDRLLPMLAPDVRRQVALFGRGGRAVLARIRRIDYDTLTQRPSLSRGQKARLICGVIAANVVGMFQTSSRRAAG